MRNCWAFYQKNSVTLCEGMNNLKLMIYLGFEPKPSAWRKQDYTYLIKLDSNLFCSPMPTTLCFITAKQAVVEDLYDQRRIATFVDDF